METFPLTLGALYNEKFKSLMEETVEDTRRWKDLPSSWIGGSDMVWEKLNIYM